MTTATATLHNPPAPASSAPTRTYEPRPHGAGDVWRHSWALAKRAIIRIRRVPESLVDVTLQPIIFTLLFSFIFGGAIAGSTADYLVLIIPGIIVQSVAFASIGIGISLRTDMDNGIFDRFRSLPIPRVAPLLGEAIASLLRYVLLVAIVTGTGYILGYRVTGGLGAYLGGAALCIAFGVSLSWAMMLVGLIARSAGAVQGITFMVLFPLTFASNAFVPADSLPTWLQWFANHNPLSYLVTSLRALWTGVGEWQHATVMTLVSCAVLTAIFMPLAIRAYNRKA
jgi:ABC transporter DrrB family efflux protein